jgi:AFG1-like ATPase
MQVLALDEFFVTDVADAVILNRLFRCGRHKHALFLSILLRLHRILSHTLPSTVRAARRAGVIMQSCHSLTCTQ